MALSIKNPDAEILAAEIAKITGETRTRAVIVALRDRLERLTGSRKGPDLARALTDISNRCRSLPDLDKRSEAELLGYNDRGTFEG